MRIDVVLPCLNEAEALPWVLSRMPAGFHPIVADNGSTDGSAQDRGASTGPRSSRCPSAASVPPATPGCWRRPATSSASWTRTPRSTPRDLPQVADPVRLGSADLMLGRRMTRSLGSWPVHARVANKVLAAELRRRTGVRLRDLGPMRCARRDQLLGLGLADRRFGYPLEMVMAAAVADWRIDEVDIPYLPRSGRSKVTGTVGGTVRTVRDMRRVLAS